ncbi:hypothetical protein CLU94_3176 [Janthinobacterium sp. 13]|nr:hypothetical protein CLU94_3176 [Janthinobacterium sp. 13]
MHIVAELLQSTLLLQPDRFDEMWSFFVKTCNEKLLPALDIDFELKDDV